MDQIWNQHAFAILPTALAGFLINWFVFYGFIRLKSMKHSFGYLSANQALADAIFCSSFLFYCSPMILFDNQFMKDNSQHSGFLNELCYELSIASHLVISVNRFCAVFVPLQYSSIFNIKHTCQIIAALWIVIGSTNVLLFEYMCQIKFNQETKKFAFTNTPICLNIAWYGDFMKNSVLVAIFMIIDVLTVIKVRNLRRKSKKESQSISEREWRFLKQTVFQGTIFMVEVLTWFLVPRITTDRVVIFFGTTFSFVLIHVLDGVIVLVCNPEIKSFVCGFEKAKTSNIILTT